MPEPAIAIVDASNDADDDRSFDEVLEVWSEADRLRHERILRAIKREDRFWLKRDGDTEQMRAEHAARSTDRALSAEIKASGEDYSWNPKRALDLQDFKYLFFHRDHFDKEIRTWLEIVNAKIIHVRQDGEDGYFKKLQKNIGWTRYITPIIFSRPSITDKLVRCNLWSNPKNSRRCHQTEFCPFCLWSDILADLVFAFGEGSGAFFNATAWFFITIGWTVNPANAKCVADDYDPGDFRPHAPDRGYDPYPIVLGLEDNDPDLAFYGYDDARTLGNIMQWAIAELYHRRYINGYHSKLESEFRLNPGGANRLNFHSHTVANGDEDNAQFIVEMLREFVYKGFVLFGRDQLERTYYPDIHVRRITSPEHLKHATRYREKVVPIGHAVADAMARPEARGVDELYDQKVVPIGDAAADALARPEVRGADGFYDPRYIARLKQSLVRLIDDDIPCIFTGARLNEELPRVFRRRTEGNLRFSDKGTCIGREHYRHKRKRRRAAKLTREARERKKEREEKMRKAGKRVPPKTKYPRRRKGSRRLPSVKRVSVYTGD